MQILDPGSGRDDIPVQAQLCGTLNGQKSMGRLDRQPTPGESRTVLHSSWAQPLISTPRYRVKAGGLASTTEKCRDVGKKWTMPGL